MDRQMTKEQVVFLVGAALFVLVMLKLGIFLTRDRTMPGAPTVPAVAAKSPDPAIGDVLATRGLYSYLERGARDDPFHGDASLGAQVFVRGLVAHSFLRTSVISRFMYDCRMSPRPLRELRFRLPKGLKVSEVFCREMDEQGKWGVDGQTLVVHVNPTKLKRAYYRTQVTIVAQSRYSAPTTWTAPVVACTDATPGVQCEVGHVTLATPGNYVQLVPRDAPSADLVKIALEAVPKKLAARSNKLAYLFRGPHYSLVVELKSPRRVASVPPKKAGPPPIKPTSPPPIKPTTPPEVKPTLPKEKGPKLVIPKAADAELLPFKLTAIVRLHDPEPRRQAVLRDKTSGEYLRKFEGEVVMDDLKVASITDDAVIIEDSKGKRYKFRGRFEDKYNE